ncbi:MAG: 2-C-methyl-D-erythritol 4-phosphate cytidylyltransferase [Bacteroidales bacterium]|nr:2-C-methyl-D-erythritol 4-phosphate cytidylyltransferase [Candidatus Physcousia equi]
MNKVIAVLLAAGSGKRMGTECPKQFLKVKGRTVLEWSISAFSRVPAVDEIFIVTREDLLDTVSALVRAGNYNKVTRVMTGGKERSDSSLAAIRAAEAQGDDLRLLIHDAVRPLVSQRIIEDCIRGLDEYEAVDVAISSTDTIIEVDEEGIIRRTPERHLLRNVQTPQGFRLATIRRAYERAMLDPDFRATDDCGVVFRYLPGIAIKVIEGDPTNIKITFPQDLEMMAARL